MGGFFFWLVVILCALALLVLFFPFRFKVEFEAGERGSKARLFFFKKQLWQGEKKWGKKSPDEEKDGADYLDGDSADKDVEDSSAAEPEFVATAPVKPVEKMAAPEKKPEPAPEKEAETASEKAPEPETVSPPAEPVEPAQTPATPAASAKEEPPKESPKESPATPAPESSATSSPEPATTPAKPATSAPEPAPEKKEKRKLTDEEFWTIILTPDLDSRAFRYVKSLLSMIVRLFNLKFVNCYVEGIRMDYATMGYGAAVNAVLKGFPYLDAWDFRMDWCRDKDLYTQGTICARTNLCRVFFLLLAALIYAGILFLLFWRRRARVLKTGELPELGFIRKKIVGWMTEE